MGPEVIKIKVQHSGSPDSSPAEQRKQTYKPEVRKSKPEVKSSKMEPVSNKRDQTLSNPEPDVNRSKSPRINPSRGVGTMDKEGFYCEEVTPATDLENKMSLLHAELTDPYDRPASIPPDEPYVDLGLIGEPRTPVKEQKMSFPDPPKELLEDSISPRKIEKDQRISEGISLADYRDKQKKSENESKTEKKSTPSFKELEEDIVPIKNESQKNTLPG